MTETKTCYGCGHPIPAYWTIPLCTKWRGDVASKGLVDGPFEPAKCGVCCDVWEREEKRETHQTAERNSAGVPWSKVHFKAGARARAFGEHPQVNPWTPGTHAFESWRAGYEEGRRPQPCGQDDCSVSTAIDDMTLTFGRGDLDPNGFWSEPCETCAADYLKNEPGTLVWPCPSRGKVSS